MTRKQSLAKTLFDAARSQREDLREWAEDTFDAILDGDTKRAGKNYARGLVRLKEIEQRHRAQTNNDSQPTNKLVKKGK